MNNIETLSKQEVAESYTYQFNSSHEDVVKSVTSAINKSKWTTKLVSKTTETKRLSGDDFFLLVLAGVDAQDLSDDKEAWVSVEPPKSATKITFVQARTPANLISFGANIYATIYTDEKHIGLKLSASTSQAFEKDQLHDYLNNLHNRVESEL
ncbi:hypothetical protein [Sinobacterium norvegicum]|uniref:hypothetical protein n=1 Tax=Sinobacterium norvegicum TaxID=1641715 RepID=UPI001F18841F|nr:hypothetical protein [Sinobacterium norvegicum]